MGDAAREPPDGLHLLRLTKLLLALRQGGLGALAVGNVQKLEHHHLFAIEIEP